MNTADLRTYLLDLQQRICTAIATVDGGAFHEDRWQRPEDAPLAGDGSSRVLAHDATADEALTQALHDPTGGQPEDPAGVFEQAGINFSHVRGRRLPPSASALRPELAGAPFEALGVSLVIHPRNPYIPTTHMNVRGFVARPEDREPVWWVGGGFDLTPYYGFVEDCRHWHRTARAACAPFGAAVYPRYKQWCDEYFFLKHRGEARGIGGLFFDDLGAEPGPDGRHWSWDEAFSFLRSVGDHFLPAYLPLVERRRGAVFGSREREFQLYRRGRYVEFNLVYDRGTLFGLQSGGRTESILMSMPPRVRWRYNWQPEPGTPEAALYRDFLPARDWLDDEDAHAGV